MPLHIQSPTPQLHVRSCPTLPIATLSPDKFDRSGIMTLSNALSAHCH